MVPPLVRYSNCLFRALADQLDDGTTTHEAVRSAVVQYIRQHEAEFSPFVEEGVSFDSYSRLNPCSDLSFCLDD